MFLAQMWAFLQSDEKNVISFSLEHRKHARRRDSSVEASIEIHLTQIPVLSNPPLWTLIKREAE